MTSHTYMIISHTSTHTEEVTHTNTLIRIHKRCFTLPAVLIALRAIVLYCPVVQTPGKIHEAAFAGASNNHCYATSRVVILLLFVHSRDTMLFIFAAFFKVFFPYIFFIFSRALFCVCIAQRYIDFYSWLFAATIAVAQRGCCNWVSISFFPFS